MNSVPLREPTDHVDTGFSLATVRFTYLLPINSIQEMQ